MSRVSGKSVFIFHFYVHSHANLSCKRLIKKGWKKEHVESENEKSCEPIRFLLDCEQIEIWKRFLRIDAFQKSLMKKWYINVAVYALVKYTAMSNLYSKHQHKVANVYSDMFTDGIKFAQNTQITSAYSVHW